MIKLVIIDFDDTLAMTEESCFIIENYIANKIGYLPMTRGDHQRNWGRPIKEAITERIPGINVEKFMELHRMLWAGFIEAGKVDVVSNANFEALKSLKESGKKLAILTARTTHEVEHLLDGKHGLNKWIEKIYHADNSEYLKPNPRVFEQIINDFGVTSDEAVYVGDSISDGVSAKGAGLYFIASLESGLRSKEDFKSVQVDFFANAFPEIINYIK